MKQDLEIQTLRADIKILKEADGDNTSKIEEKKLQLNNLRNSKLLLT